MSLTRLEPCCCPEVCDRLSEFLDGELGPIDRVRLGLHLAACPRCAVESASLDATVRALRDLARQGRRARLSRGR